MVLAMTEPTISIIIPSRDRPQGLLAAINSIRATEAPHFCEIVAVLDEPDRVSQAAVADLPGVKVIIGGPGDTYLGRPQDKYNMGYRAATGDWIVTGSDDITFESDGWLDECLRLAARRGYCGISDGGQEPTWCCVIHMASRTYIDTTMRGYLGLPWYNVWWADVEWTQRAIRCGAWAANTSLKLTHHHWARGNATADHIAELIKKLAPADQETYTRRSKRNFSDDTK